MTMKGSKVVGGGRRRGDGGFTLIESLTASAILLVVSVGVITTLIATASWYANARLRTEAFAVANQVMTNILSRNYSDIHFTTTGETYPSGISEQMSWPANGTAQFTVQTTMETTTDDLTGLEMKRIDVSAIPVGRSLEPTVTVTRFASGWQSMATSTDKFPVTVQVQLNAYQNNQHTSSDLQVGPGGNAGGVRVQLLDVDTLTETRFAVTDDNGVATFYNVPEDQYFLTCDPRFGTSIRPVHFPMRIAPTHGGSKSNPINTINSYNLLVTKSATGALLRVGAYATEGWTVVDGVAQPPEVPYRVIPNLVVYASPVLNTGSAGSYDYYGLGSSKLYPDESKLPVYSATVNAYGVAAIPIPFTIESGQYWHVWCRTRDANGVIGTPHTLTTVQSGDWTTQVQRPEGASGSSAVYGSIPQWSWLGAGATADNDPTPPDSF